MLKKISILIAVLFLFYACNRSDEGAVKSIADLEKRVSKVNSMNTELEKQKNSTPYVFPNPKTGKPYDNVWKSFKTACKKAAG